MTTRYLACLPTTFRGPPTPYRGWRYGVGKTPSEAQNNAIAGANFWYEDYDIARIIIREKEVPDVQQ